MMDNPTFFFSNTVEEYKGNRLQEELPTNIGVIEG